MPVPAPAKPAPRPQGPQEARAATHAGRTRRPPAHGDGSGEDAVPRPAGLRRHGTRGSGPAKYDRSQARRWRCRSDVPNRAALPRTCPRPSNALGCGSRSRSVAEATSRSSCRGNRAARSRSSAFAEPGGSSLRKRKAGAYSKACVASGAFRSCAARGHRGQPLLPLEQGLFRSGEEVACWRHGPRSDQ